MTAVSVVKLMAFGKAAGTPTNLTVNGASITPLSDQTFQATGQSGHNGLNTITPQLRPLGKVSPSITLRYDMLNRLTNQIDAVGTTVYGYDAAGQ